VPFHPIDFDTLEIEIQKAPAILRGRFHLLAAISLTGFEPTALKLPLSLLTGRI
jgi:hypothetical protein